MPQWHERIDASFSALQQPYSRRAVGDGHLLLMVHGARVLGASLPGLEGNLLWHNPELEDPDRAGAILSVAGRDIGGDRLWIGPQAAYLQSNGQQPPAFNLPAQLDPGNWEVFDDTPEMLSLEAQVVLNDVHQRQWIGLRLGRQFTLIDPPQGLDSSLRWAGFAIQNELFLTDGPPGALAGAWDALQLPAGGWFIAPTLAEAPMLRPRPLMEAMELGNGHGRPESGARPRAGEGSERVAYADRQGPPARGVTEQGLCVPVRGESRWGLGLPPEALVGRLGYYRPGREVSSLVVRCFSVYPGLPYAEPLEARANRPSAKAQSPSSQGPTLRAVSNGGQPGAGVVYQGDAAQLRCHGPDPSFAELSYHEPALIMGRGPMARGGLSITHLMAGPDESIRRAGRLLLGGPLPEYPLAQGASGPGVRGE